VTGGASASVATPTRLTRPPVANKASEINLLKNQLQQLPGHVAPVLASPPKWPWHRAANRHSQRSDLLDTRVGPLLR
jgi:hypothetical protein